uniref:Uncharacterized protein n=1 Tax=Pyramimonas obovata TaxID=1411642 RepID=A0A7S0WLM9_9CHLO
MLEGGGAPNVRDRWAATPMDDALRAGHAHVQALLEKAGGRPSEELPPIKEVYQAASERNLKKRSMESNSTASGKPRGLRLSSSKRKSSPPKPRSRMMSDNAPKDELRPTSGDRRRSGDRGRSSRSSDRGP